MRRSLTQSRSKLLRILFAFPAAAMVVIACTDNPSATVGPAAPSVDLTTLTGAASALGVTPFSTEVNLSGTAAEVCNSAPLRGEHEPTTASAGRTWLGEKIKNPARTLVAGGFQLTLSPDKRFLSWTSIAEDTYTGTSRLMTAVVVKAGNTTSIYYYNPNFTTDADGLPPNNGAMATDPNDNIVRGDASLAGRQQEIGHVVVCYVERLFNPKVSLALIGKDAASYLEPVEYTVTLTNTSPLGTRNVNCEVTGDLGTIEFRDMEPDETRTVTVSHTITDGDPNPYAPKMDASCDIRDFDDVIASAASFSTPWYPVDFTISMTGTPDVLSIGDVILYTIRITNLNPATVEPVVCEARTDRTGFVGGGPFLPGGTTRTIEHAYTTLSSDPSAFVNTLTVRCRTIYDLPTGGLAQTAAVTTTIVQPPTEAGRVFRGTP